MNLNLTEIMNSSAFQAELKKQKKKKSEKITGSEYKNSLPVFIQEEKIRIQSLIVFESKKLEIEVKKINELKTFENNCRQISIVLSLTENLSSLRKKYNDLRHEGKRLNEAC